MEPRLDQNWNYSNICSTLLCMVLIFQGDCHRWSCPCPYQRVVAFIARKFLVGAVAGAAAPAAVDASAAGSVFISAFASFWSWSFHFKVP